MSIFSRKKGKNEIPKTETVKTETEYYSMGYKVSSFQGIGKRTSQQDAYYVKNARDVVEAKKNGLLAVVADGMGGMADGGKASAIVIDSLVASFDKINRKADIAIQLYQAVRAANDAVYAALGGKGGSTVIACICFDGRLYYAGVGDSGLFLLRDGQLCRLNREQNCLHSAYMETVCSDSMDTAYAESIDEKAALSQFVGMALLEDVDLFVRPLPLESGDVILLCSDGVSGVISQERMSACLSNGSPHDMCSRLEENLIRVNKQYQDNYTAVVIQCCY